MGCAAVVAAFAHPVWVRAFAFQLTSRLPQGTLTTLHSDPSRLVSGKVQQYLRAVEYTASPRIEASVC